MHRFFQSCSWRPALADSKGDATDVNEQTKSGMTPLMCAVKVLGPKNGDDGIVAFLLENKANVNLQDVMGDTVLHIACCSKVIAVCPSLFLSVSLSLLLARARSVSLQHVPVSHSLYRARASARSHYQNAPSKHSIKGIPDSGIPGINIRYLFIID